MKLTCVPDARGGAGGGSTGRSGVLRAGGGTLAIITAVLALHHVPHFEGYNLEFRPDALDYAVVARRLADGDAPTLPLGDGVYPSRYPIGFPLLLVPAVLLGVPPDGLWVVSAVLAVCGVGLTYVAALEVSGPIVATWAALLLALAPLYLRFGVMTMSDVPATAAAAAWAYLIVAQRQCGTLGVMAGFACSIRLMCAPLVLTGAIAAGRRGVRPLAQFISGAALGLLPLPVAWFAGWSGPLAGYAFWIPERYGVPTSALDLPALAHNLPRYLHAVAGLGGGQPAFYPFPVAVLAVMGAWSARGVTDRGGLRFLAATAVLLLLLALGYFFQNVRLLLPLLPLVLVLAAAGLRAAARRSVVLATVLAASVLLPQVRHGLRARLQTPPRVFIAPTLTAVTPRLPPAGVVVSDVPAALAWLYWTRRTAREFVPLAVPPATMRGALVDRMLFRLSWNATHGYQVVAPTTLLGDSGVSPAGRQVIVGAIAGDLPVTVVLCTGPLGHDLLPKLASVFTLVPLSSAPPCELMSLSLQPQTARVWPPPLTRPRELDLLALPGGFLSDRANQALAQQAPRA